MTDPDKRNITDQRYADDAAQRYLADSSQPRTHAEWLHYFRERYGDTYEVSAPSAPGGQWKASALFGQRDQLSEWSPTALLDELHDHRSSKYPGSGDEKWG